MAVDGLMLSYGHGMNDALIQNQNISGASHQSIGLFWGSEYHFDHEWFGYSELEFEAYYSQIKLEQTRQIIAFRPILNFWGNKNQRRNWYWQFGVGISYFDDKQFMPVTLSTKGQFATMFGIGIPFNQQQNRLTLRYNHYSNAYLKKPNPGLDTISLDWHVSF
ncbi:acyloxyacyl hydrolase [Aliikangiella marina]|nr:acyloxyacyl hydrolase [Aliikangiella marina]